MMRIDKTAKVSGRAKLDKGVQVGPYSIIGDNCVLGADVRIGSHCVLEGNTSIGKNCQVFTGAVIGSQPQDLKYKGEKTFLEIGENNIVREFCTLNTGTGEGGKTIIGNNNLLMAYAHIAHDCVVGNHCVIANVGTLAGHVTIEDNVVIGGLAAIHQFVRVGRFSIIGGCSKVVQDIPPFSTCDGHPARVYGLNLVGLKRKGINKQSLDALKHAFKILFNSGLTIKNAVLKVEKEIKATEEIACLIDFVKDSHRGISRSCRAENLKDDSSG